MKKILVVGDVMLDTYFKGDISRISPEAPVPVFLKKREYSVLGGAANVACNIKTANQEVSILGLVGKDNAGDRLVNIMLEHGIDTSLIIKNEGTTIEKTRFVSAENQQVLRSDVEKVVNITDEEADNITALLEKRIDEFSIVIISDYSKGLLTKYFTQKVISLANDRKIPVLVDVKDVRFEKYSGAYLLKPNKKELHALTEMPVNNKDEIVAAASMLLKKASCNYVLATLGADGMVLVGDGNPYWISATDKEVFDVTGAGDTAIAYLACSLMDGKDIREAVEIANIASGIQVSKLGTSPVYTWEVKEDIKQAERGVLKKFLRKSEIERFREEHKKSKIVFTNGCFDILHCGHLRYLQEAKKLGDILIVGLNSDSSVKELKGENRPINSEMERAEMLCSLEFVDYVVLFSENNPYNLIKVVQPDILVKGADYNVENVIGKDLVEERGGRVELITFVEGKSTTNIISKIADQVKGVNE